MNEYEFAAYFWFAVVAMVVAITGVFALAEKILATIHGHADDRRSEPSLPSIPSCPSSPA